MKIALRKYNNAVSIVTVPDNTTEIAVINLSGDQIMVYPVFHDTGACDRFDDHFDGHRIFRVAELENAEIEGEDCLLVSGI